LEVISLIRLFLKVEGIVQGVGLRPYVYNQAISLGLKGWINNNSQGVHIDIEGDKENVQKMIDNLKNNPPPQAKIVDIQAEERVLINYKNFQIRKSQQQDKSITLVSPDIATCEKCVQDIGDPGNKRYKYPFTNCTNCGPRFSIIKSIPYDRNNTTMKKFEMCSFCSNEYIDTNDRRFHTQPNACHICGPHIWIEDFQGIKINEINALEFAKQKLKKGKILAVKGIGGFHLVCDAENEDAVNALRKRKKRPDKPFAVMVKNIETAKKYCLVNKKEEEILMGSRKPVVILDRASGYDLPESIAPGQKTLGVMIPFTPLHYLLLEEDFPALIMTSANINGLPLEYVNESASENLRNVADYFLMHDRDIHIPIDDSVVKITDNEVYMIRRARGYVPEALNKDRVREILALGSNMKNTFSIGKNGKIFLSQHNGNLNNEESKELYISNIDHFKEIFSFNPQYLACDMHPGYASREYACSSGLPIIEVQHHHAHIASCLGENNVSRKVIGIAFDGTGYGTDGKIWGGEFILCDNKEFRRAGHLDYVKMPGGEQVIREPWRIALAYMYKVLKSDEKFKEISARLYSDKCKNIISVLKADINSPETSSMGRLFDAAASLMGIRDYITFEGQAAMELEAAAEGKSLDYYKYDIVKGDEYVVKTGGIIEGIIEDRLSGEEKGIISDKVHNTIVKFSVDVCKLIRKETSINEVALSGGVFQNLRLLKNMMDNLRKDKFVVYTNKLIPANDGGISFGQIIVANEIINDLI